MIGTALNQYNITTRVGAGRMGEVFRALDTRLNRDVAVKVGCELSPNRLRIHRERRTDCGARACGPGLGLLKWTHDAGPRA